MWEKQRCPRRDETGQMGGEKEDTPDMWVVRSMGDRTIGDQVRTCNYCGSMNPDDLLVALDNRTCVVGPTDKNYKMYLHEIATPEEKAATNAVSERIVGYTRYDAELRAVSSGKMMAKFYFQHFSPEQRKRFFDILQSGNIIFGYPGYFYILPFFVRPAK